MGNLLREIQYRRRLRRRIQQAGPYRITILQGATVVASCMVAAFCLWGMVVLLLALAPR